MAVAKNGLALEHVFCQTASICEIAIMQNPMALSYVQDQISYLEKLAIMGDGNILEIIDSEHSFPEMYNIAIIRSRGNAIQFIPKNNQTSELRRLALICDSKNIQYLDLPTENELKILAMTNWEKIEENYPNSSPDVKILAQIQNVLYLPTLMLRTIKILVVLKFIIILNQSVSLIYGEILILKRNKMEL